MPEEDKKEKKEPQPRKRRGAMRWLFPLGIAAAGLGSAATILLRGCWHTKMGWPIRLSTKEGGQQEGISYSYQVCMRCGIKRLFDPESFRGYGPFGYDVQELIARDRAARARHAKKASEAPLPPKESQA